MNDEIVYTSRPRPLEVPSVIIGYYGDLIISLVGKTIESKSLNNETVGKDYLRLVWLRVATQVCSKARDIYNLSPEQYAALTKAFLKPNHYYIIS